MLTIIAILLAMILLAVLFPGVVRAVLISLILGSIIVVGALALYGAAFAGEEPTAHQAAMTRIAAKLVYGESRCRDRYEFNTPGLAALGRAYGVSMEDWRPNGRLRVLLMSEIEALKAKHDGAGEDIFCLAWLSLYGPSGSSLPEMMKAR